MWLPDTERQLVRQIAPGFQQTSGLKLDAERLREKGIVKLNLRYTKVTNEDVRYSLLSGRCVIVRVLCASFLNSSVCIPGSAAAFLIIPACLIHTEVSFQVGLLSKWAAQSYPYSSPRIQAVPRSTELTLITLHANSVYDDTFWNTNIWFVWWLLHCQLWKKMKVFHTKYLQVLFHPH